MADVRGNGPFGEKYVEERLKSDGFKVIRQTDWTGPNHNTSPRASGEAGYIILPDFGSFTKGQSADVEAKCYSFILRYENRNQLLHGITERHFEHYIEYERESGRKVMIVVVERPGKEPKNPAREIVPPELTSVGHWLSYLQRRIVRVPHGLRLSGNQEDQVYFPRDLFFPERDWRRALRGQVYLPPVQGELFAVK